MLIKGSQLFEEFSICCISNIGNGGGIGTKNRFFSYVYLFDSVIENNKACQSGGGVYSTENPHYIISTSIRNNSAENAGGGLYLDGGKLNLSDSSIVNNTATVTGGGIHGYTLTANIDNSTISLNNLNNATSTPTLGAGMYALGNRLTITNSTISTNKSIGQTSVGGGLYLDFVKYSATNSVNTSAILNHVTFAYNEAGAGGNLASSADNQGTISVKNTILVHANNLANCDIDLVSKFPTLLTSVNISSDESCGLQNLTWRIEPTAAIIETLLEQRNQGTLVHALAINSPAINASVSTECPETDQRLMYRDLTDLKCDLGAMELTATIPQSNIIGYSTNSPILFKEDGGTISYTTVTINLTRTGNTTNTSSVQYRTEPGSAGILDYDPILSGEMVFKPGETIQTIMVNVMNDHMYEENENFFIKLFGPKGNASLDATRSSVEVVIEDGGDVLAAQSNIIFLRNDRFNTPIKMNETAVGHLLYVERIYSSDAPASVDYAITPTALSYRPVATNNIDFTLQSGTIYFSHGQRTQALTVYPINDTLSEGPEYFTVKLSNAQSIGNIILGTPEEIEQVVEIVDDDALPWQIEFDKNAFTIDEYLAGYNVTVWIRGGQNTKQITVQFRLITAQTTATDSLDYNISTNREFTVNPKIGTDYKFIIPIDIINDNMAENSEFIALELYNPTPNAAILGATNKFTLEIKDDDSLPGKLTFEQADYQVNETAQTIRIPIVRTEGTGGKISIDYAVQAISSAVRDIDYTFTDGSLTFLDGESSKDLFITIIDDQEIENDETIVLLLSQKTGNANVGAIPQTTLTIAKNDMPPSASFSQASYNIEETQQTLTIPVNLDVATIGQGQINYSVNTNSTATNGQDFNLTNGTLVFKQGETSKDINITINDDTETEDDETIVITLSGPSGAIIQGLIAETTIIIAKNDQLPTISFKSKTMALAEQSNRIKVEVLRMGDISGVASIDFFASGGTAIEDLGNTPNADFKFLSDSSLTFTAEQRLVTFFIQVYDDGISEPTETIEISLRNPSNALLDAGSTLLVRIRDPDSANNNGSSSSSGGGSLNFFFLGLLFLLIHYRRNYSRDY